MRDRDASIGSFLVFVPSVLVLLQAIAFYGFVIRARIALGGWPSPDHLDPGDLGFTIHHVLVWLGFFLQPSLLIFYVILRSAATELGAPRATLRASVICFAVVFSAGVLVLLVDPGRFGEWFTD
jgi:hypothetical protein